MKNLIIAFSMLISMSAFGQKLVCTWHLNEYGVTNAEYSIKSKVFLEFKGKELDFTITKIDGSTKTINLKFVGMASDHSGNFPVYRNRQAFNTQISKDVFLEYVLFNTQKQFVTGVQDNIRAVPNYPFPGKGKCTKP